MKTKILVLSIHAAGDGACEADYAIVLLTEATRSMLQKRMELVRTLQKQDRDVISVNFFGEPDLIISSDQFDEIFADQTSIGQVVEIDTDALNAIKSQTEIEGGLRLQVCDLRVYDDNCRWYLYEKYSGIEMFTDEVGRDQLNQCQKC